MGDLIESFSQVASVCEIKHAEKGVWCFESRLMILEIVSSNHLQPVRGQSVK